MKNGSSFWRLELWSLAITAVVICMNESSQYFTCLTETGVGFSAVLQDQTDLSDSATIFGQVVVNAGGGYDEFTGNNLCCLVLVHMD